MAIDLGIIENPKIPTTVPARPYTATPASWKRTQFLTPGQFTFTPDADTTLVMAIALGGGGGGIIFKTAGGIDTVYDPDVNAGQDSTILVNGVVVLNGRGGGGLAGSAFAPRGTTASPGATAFNWLRNDAGVNGASGLGNGSTSSTGAAGGAPSSILTGTAGAQWTITGMPQPFSNVYGGGAGSSVAMYLEATSAITFTVGKGGLGVNAGYSPPASANGTLGGGGAGGANGGDGAVIFYEFKGALTGEKPTPQTITAYSTLAGTAGNYLTVYPGRTNVGDFINYSHTLRPRTKFVTLLMVGGGGGSIVGTLRGALNKADPTQLTLGNRTFIAVAGSSSGKTDQQGMIQPPFGTFTATNYEAIDSRDGTSSSNPGGANQQGIGGGYGNGGQGLQGAGDGSNSTLPGASGAVGLIGFSRAVSGDTISFNVGGAGFANTATYSAGATGAMFVYESETPPAPSTTQTSELVLLKSVPATTRFTQTAELILVKESNDVDTQVSTIYAAVVLDLPEANANVTQTSELILQKSQVGASNVTQTSELILAKSPVASVLTSQVSQLFLLSEIPTVFYLNFGTLHSPIRLQLYDSLEGRASSVPPNTVIQIEGPVAPGTQLVVNGVNKGMATTVVDGDRVKINGGVTTYWQTHIPVYAYYEQNGEQTRMLVGDWIIDQPPLTPVITKAYYGSQVKPTWIITKTNVAKAAMTSLIAQANAAVAAPLIAMVAQGLSALASLTSEISKSLSAMASLTVESVKAHAELSGVSTQWDYAQTNANTVQAEWQATQAKSHTSQVLGYELPQAKYGEFIGEFDKQVPSNINPSHFDGDAVLLSVNYAPFTIETQQTQAGYGAFEQTEFDLLKAAYDEVDVEYERGSFEGPVLTDAEYKAIPGSAVSRTFDVTAIPTIAYSVLTNIVWDRSAAEGTGIWIIPTESALNPQAKYGTFELAPALADSGHSEYTERETLHLQTGETGYFERFSLWMTNGYGSFGKDAEKTSANSSTFEMEQEKAAANYGVYGLTPFLDMQSVNGVGAASLYKGFDSLADIQQFTENFADVTISMKYNGYVYTLAVDKSFVCEIFSNAPVKWLLQGG